MRSTKLPCQICAQQVPIRSTIKTGDHEGKKVCPVCKEKYDSHSPLKPSTRLRRITPKTQARRKEERAGYPKFFRLSIEELKLSPTCQNCGGSINYDYEPVRNIAHILPKQRYKSVATHPENKLFLCASKDNRNACHERFDSGVSSMKEMPVFPLAIKKFQKFKGEVAENGKLFHILAEY